MREGNGPHPGLASLVGRAAPRHQAQLRHLLSPDERLRERPGPHQSRASLRGRGIKPTIVIHSALTSTCEKETDLTQALRLL